MNKAMVYGPHHSLLLLFSESNRAGYLNAEIAEPGRLLQLVGGHSNFHATVVEVAGSEILHRVESRAGTQRCKQKLGGVIPLSVPPFSAG